MRNSAFDVTLQKNRVTVSNKTRQTNTSGCAFKNCRKRKSQLRRTFSRCKELKICLTFKWLKVYKFGPAKKKGKHAWAKRSLKLIPGMLVVYREENDENPLNVIMLKDAKIESSETEFSITTQYRVYEFDVDNTVSSNGLCNTSRKL